MLPEVLPEMPAWRGAGSLFPAVVWLTDDAAVFVDRGAALFSAGVIVAGGAAAGGVLLAVGNFCINSPGVGICAAWASRIISISQAAAGLGACPSSPCPFSSNCHARPRRAIPLAARPVIISRSLSINASSLPPAACILARWIKSSRSPTSISGSAPRL